MIRSASSIPYLPAMGGPDLLVVHQQDEVANGESRALVRVVERMADRKRIQRESSNLRNGGILELIGEVHVDATEYGTDGCVHSRPRQSSVSCQQVFVQVGDLLLCRQRDAHRFAR